MPDLRKYGVYIAALVVAVLVWFITGSYYKSNIADLKLSYAKHEKELADANIKAITDAEQKQKKLQLDLAAAAYRFHEDLTNALSKNDDLRHDIDLANKRLSIHIQTRSCATTTNDPSGRVMDNGETAFLAADSRQAYLDLRQNIILTESKLSACQDYSAQIQRQYGIKEKPQ